MKQALKVIILFLIIFRFRLPVLFDTTFLSIVLCSLYYLLTKKTLPFTYFFYRYTVNIFVGIMLLFWVYIFITVMHQAYDFSLSPIFGFKVAMLFALVYAMPLLMDGDEENAFESALATVCYAFAVQGFIILIAFLIPPFGDLMISMKPNSEEIFNNNIGQFFRNYALAGTTFFELPAGFGVAWILFIRLLTVKNQSYFTGYKPYVIFVLFFIGTMFTGRTAFVGLMIAIVMGLIIIRNSFNFIGKQLIPVTVLAVLLIVAYAFLPDKQKNQLTDNVFPFAFEAYYSYETTGRVATNSSDAMIYYHYYKLSDKTLLYGDGKYASNEGGYYGGSDAGYMRNAMYGGIPFILCLILYELLFFFKPFSISGRLRNTEEGRGDFLLFAALFIHIFFLEYKGSTLGFMNIMEALLFFAGFSYVIRHYYREDHE